MQLYDRYKQKGVVFVGLTPEGEQAQPEIEDFIKRYGISWPNGYGAESTNKLLGVTMGYPTIFVIGADGKVTWNDELGGTLPDAINQALAAAARRAGQ